MNISFNILCAFLGFVVLALIMALGYTLYLLTIRDENIAALEAYQAKMNRSFQELDEQAKLIIRTDLELNRAQSTLEQRLDALNAIQRATRSISQALNENEIYIRLTPALFQELHFSKVLIMTIDESKTFKSRLALQFTPQQIETIVTQTLTDEIFKAPLQEQLILSSLTATRKIKDRVTSLFNAEHFILCPITTQTGSIGFIFVGNRLSDAAITQGDAELIGILAGQIGQAIENALLFEKVFKSSQELEIKVKDRTKQLAQALAAVEDISKKKSAFISAVSHELRTPLTSIKGFAALLIAGKIGEVPDSVKERLIKINNHSDNLVSLINNLLDIARIESGRVEMKFSSHQTKSVVDNVVDLLTPQLTSKEIVLDVQVSSQVPQLYIDHSQAERVFINLLSNAVKFTPKNGRINISISRHGETDFAVCQVSDSGIGIPPEEIKNLFSEFYRIDNEINQHVKGTGLGLVLAKNIVQAHKGQIWVHSQVGSGTTFAFTLPMSAQAIELATKDTPQHA